MAVIFVLIFLSWFFLPGVQGKEETNGFTWLVKKLSKFVKWQDHRLTKTSVACESSYSRFVMLYYHSL